jgi:hypothetical protein
MLSDTSPMFQITVLLQSSGYNHNPNQNTAHTFPWQRQVCVPWGNAKQCKKVEMCVHRGNTVWLLRAGTDSCVSAKRFCVGTTTESRVIVKQKQKATSCDDLSPCFARRSRIRLVLWVFTLRFRGNTILNVNQNSKTIPALSVASDDKSLETCFVLLPREPQTHWHTVLGMETAFRFSPQILLQNLFFDPKNIWRFKLKICAKMKTHFHKNYHCPVLTIEVINIYQ